MNDAPVVVVEFTVKHKGMLQRARSVFTYEIDLDDAIRTAIEVYSAGSNRIAREPITVYHRGLEMEKHNGQWYAIQWSKDNYK